MHFPLTHLISAVYSLMQTVIIVCFSSSPSSFSAASFPCLEPFSILLMSVRWNGQQTQTQEEERLLSGRRDFSSSACLNLSCACAFDDVDGDSRMRSCCFWDDEHTFIARITGKEKKIPLIIDIILTPLLLLLSSNFPSFPHSILVKLTAFISLSSIHFAFVFSHTSFFLVMSLNISFFFISLDISFFFPHIS
ncbi:unnamed protein product [Acanthosepion pharaonis]|uniref:Uncharacterized protein n=1 Tax=Acanthosepion pharaonis TaxID=158019 RepID=A0A812AU75_ACAPH|nr:unnamed protein product [Sepia pharaonis]